MHTPPLRFRLSLHGHHRARSASLTIGSRFGGQMMATSFAAPLSPVPVLSPAIHSFGKPPRRRLNPVRQFFIQPVNFSRDSCVNTSPRRILFIVITIALGVVISRSSPG